MLCRCEPILTARRAAASNTMTPLAAALALAALTACAAWAPTAVAPSRLRRRPVLRAVAAAPLRATPDGGGADPADRAQLADTTVARMLAGRLSGCNVFLVGMMGSGKSSTGDRLAKLLGSYSFLDTDAVIEQMAGGERTVSTIFEADGEEAFRDAESSVLDSMQAFVRCVIATGGGSVMRPGNWAKLQTGLVVRLDVPTDLLLERMRAVPDALAKRPLLAGADPAGALQAIADARATMYSQADVTVAVGADDTTEKTVRDIIDAIDRFMDDNPPRWKTWKEDAEKDSMAA